jgi:hypothetical protein
MEKYILGGIINEKHNLSKLFGLRKKYIEKSLNHLPDLCETEKGIMNNNSIKLFIFILSITILFLIGCSTPGPSEPQPFKALGGSTAVDISDFNDDTIYTIIVPEPAGKPESDGAPSTTYNYILSSGSKLSLSPPSSMNEGTSDENCTVQQNGVYSPAQTNLDLFLRQTENQVLSNKARQLSRIPPGIVGAAPFPISVGTTWNGVQIVATGNTINTTCRAISNHAYFFVDNRDTVAMSSYLAGYATTFDAIYDVNHARFGTENDTDGNGKVIIVFTEELTGGILGYFFSHDKYSSGVYADSNEGDIFYITTDAIYQGNIVNGTLAHEFQHMIYFDEHYNHGVTLTYAWLNEALSQAAEYYNGYLDNHHAWIAYFLEEHWAGLSLTHWTSSNYGYGAVWIRYVRDRCGNTAIRNMCSTGLIGIAAVENATGMDFNTLFNDFTRALVMSGTGDSDSSKYNFSTLDLQAVQPNGRGGLTTSYLHTAGYSGSGGLFAYRIHFAEWTGEFGTITLTGTDIAGTAFGLSQ